jgi:hypothetical protein
VFKSIKSWVCGSYVEVSGIIVCSLTVCNLNPFVTMSNVCVESYQNFTAWVLLILPSRIYAACPFVDVFKGLSCFSLLLILYR